VISAVYNAVCVRLDVFPAATRRSTTTATLLRLALLWVIEHDCVRPMVLTHDDVFGPGLGLLGAAET
jgi:hypothetical protein